MEAQAATGARGRTLLLILRYGLPAALMLAGIAILVLDEGTRRWEGFAMCVGAALSLLFLTTVFGMGAKGDLEREDEEAAREYLRVHGHWPDEPAPRAPVAVERPLTGAEAPRRPRARRRSCR